MNKITKRWFVNNFIVILVILIIIEILVSLGIRSFYYNNVEEFIKSQGLAMLNLIDKSYKSSLDDFEFELRSMIESFEQKDKMEVMVLNENGKVLLTSNGFDVENQKETPDYDIIKEMESKLYSPGYAQAVYELNNENVMAVIYPVETKIKDIGYIRFVSSITNVDRQIVIIIAITALIAVFIIFFVVISSSYFIQSIVVPVDEISKTAKRIAHGDFNIRLERQTDDEIGDLCDTINHMAEELSVTEKIKNEFISSVSHELRTPLTAIRGWAETVSSCSPSDQDIIKKGLKVISDETQRLSSMVEELLDFSRIQRGKMTLILSKLDLVAELEDILIIFQERAKKESVLIESDFTDECLPIFGDKNRLKQVFTNVIDNAFKYSDKDKKVIITAEKNLNFAVVKIIDNGCGIDPRDLPKIKEKFYKANYSKRGSGIGLAVADEIIKLHKGSLDVYSVEDKGTTIVIQIPIYKNNKLNN
ncbi:MAG: HAMP domain-containing histidine kinase [Oscillospiraceae bacterium]|nr:HAMP domain-containing histidine kinase [Oscillospiraceae bacterium]